MTLGGPQTQEIQITPELKEKINAGLKQVNDLGGKFKIENPTQVIVLSHTTQVVAGTLDNLLLEVRGQKGSKLVSMKLFDQPWTGIVNQLEEACVHKKASGQFLHEKCSTGAECQALLDKKGSCQDLSY